MQEIKLHTLQGSAARRSETRRQWHSLALVLLVLDALCVLGSLTLAYIIRIDGLPYHAEAKDEVYRGLVVVAVPIWLACFALLGLYHKDNLLGGIVEYKQVIKGCTIGLMLLVVYVVFARVNGFEPSRGWLILSWVISMAMIGATRFFMRRIVYRLREHGYLTSRVLIVGANDQGLAIAEQWMHTPASGMNVVGFLDDFKAIGTAVVGNVKVVGRPSALDTLSRQYRADEVIVVSTAVAWESFGELVTNKAADRGYTLRLSPGFYELLTTGVAVTTKTFVPLLTIQENRIVGFDALLKSFLDYGLGGALAVLSAPFGMVIALLLKVSDPRAPLLSRTQVIGRGGRPFDMLRFNTCGSDVRASSHRWGRAIRRWLRRTGLDKMPQLWNVLCRQMSLVGPRPRTAHDRVTDMHLMHNLQAVKPGIVGPWVRRDHLKSPDLVRDELNYIRNWQIWADLPILYEAAATLVGRLTYTGRRRAVKAMQDEPEGALGLDKRFQEDMLY